MDNKTYKSYYPIFHWEKWGNELVKKLISGESVCIYGMYGCAREVFTRHFSVFIKDYETKPYVLIEIRADFYTSVETPELINLIINQIVSQYPYLDLEASFESINKVNPYVKLLDIINTLIKKDIHIYFVIDYLERWLTNHSSLKLLADLRDVSTTNISFLTTTDLSIISDPENYKKSAGVIFSNLTLVPHFSITQAERMMKANSKVFNWKYNKGVLEKVYALSGGNPGLIKYLHRIATTLNHFPTISEIIENDSIKYKIEIHLNEIQILLKLENNFNGKIIASLDNEQIKILQKANYLNRNRQFFCPILTFYFKNQVNTTGFENNLSSNEYKLYQLFNTSWDVIINSEDIAEAIWGKEAESKYSLWAIYKLISNLNKQLKGNNLKIINLRNRGYKLSRI